MASSSTSSNLTGVFQTFYDKVFLDRAKATLVFDWGAQKKRVPANSGKVVAWNRFSPLALATTALTETPSGSTTVSAAISGVTAVDMTTTVVSTTVATYGNYTIVSDLFNLTSLDENLKEHSEIMGQNAGETIDALLVKELSANATAQIANSKVLSTLAATDTLTGAEIRKAVRTLKTNKAMRFENGLYRGIVQPFTAYDLFGNSEWQNTFVYTNTDNIQQGIVGRIHGVEFRESNNSSSEASTATVYHNYIFGKNAYGMVDVAGNSSPKMFVKNPGAGDTANPLNIFSTVGWKIFFAAKVLNANWVLNVKSGATA